MAVVIPCHGDGEFVGATVRSIDEAEPIEIVVVDDGSPDAATHSALDQLEADGHRVVRLPTNQGVSAARNAGLEATEAPYVFPLDADDLVIPGVLSRMADRLERSATPVVCFGDYVEFHHETAVRTVPERLDPYRLAYADEYPPGSLFRRSVIETIGGWRELGPVHTDHDLWMTIAERGIPAVHLGAGELSHRRRREPDPDSDGGWTQGARARAIARAAHPGLFAQVSDHRPISDRIRAPLDRLRSRAPQR